MTGRPSRNSRRTLTFASARPAIHVPEWHKASSKGTNNQELSSKTPAEHSIRCEAISTVAAEICDPTKCPSLGTLWVVSTKIIVANTEGTNTGDPPSTEPLKAYVGKDKTAPLSMTYAPPGLNIGALKLSGLGDKLELYNGATKINEANASWSLENGGTVPGNLYPFHEWRVQDRHVFADRSIGGASPEK